MTPRAAWPCLALALCDEAASAYAAALERHQAARPGADPPVRLMRKQLETQGGY